MQRLRRACENAKRTLSTATSATVDLDGRTSAHTANSVCFTPSRCEQVELEALKDGVDLRETISRARFEELCLDLFKKTMAPVTQVLRP